MFAIKAGPQIINGRKLFTIDKWQEQLSEIGLTENCDWWKLEPGELVNDSIMVKVFKVKLSSGVSIYFKKYSLEGREMRYFMRQSKCATEVNSYQFFQECGVPTIDPIAFGEERKMGKLISCCIVTLEVPNIGSLRDFITRDWPVMNKDEQKDAYLKISTKLVEYVKKIHDKSFFHYDLKWRNILINRDGEEYQVYFIDSPRGKKMPLRSSRGRVADLSALSRQAILYLSHTQRYRFLLDYLGADADRQQVKEFWRKIEAHYSRRPPRRSPAA